MKNAVRNVVCVSITVLVLSAVQQMAAQGLAGGAPSNSLPRQERKFVISRTEPDTATDMSLEEIGALWPVFPHAPYAESGFNHLTLPFHTSTNAPHAREEARAFAFLLSNALDWVPGNYCARHAYFVFKRARPEMLALEQTYDPAAIALQMERWQATHAIGGEIAKGPAGYTGKLLIFDSEGTVSLEKTYDKPQSYFDLLGDMCDDCSQHIGHKPSAALSAHFRKPRCEKEESIWDLGAAAFQEERTGEEFRCYRKIVERDPVFSEVRYWIANQGYWQHNNRALYQQQKEECLDHYLTESVLEDYDVTRENVAKYERYVDQAQALVGADSPFIVECRLEVAQVKGCLTPALLDQGLAVASRYPNSSGLLGCLRDVVWNAPRGPADADLAIALSLTQLGSPYMRGSSSQDRYIVGRMAEAIAELGREDIAGSLVAGNIQDAFEDGEEESAVFYMGQLGVVYRLTRQYKKAIDVNCAALKLQTKRQSKTGGILAVTAVCAAFLGDRTTFDDMKQQFIVTEGDQGMKSVLITYGQFMDGKPVNVKQLQSCSKGDLLVNRLMADYRTKMYLTNQVVNPRQDATAFLGLYPRNLTRREATVLLAESDLANGTTNQWQRMTEYLNFNPNDREFWVLFDAYDRKNPRQDSGLFYESLAWLHPESSWVSQAVKDYRERAKAAVSPDVADYQDILKTRAPDPWCGLTGQRDTSALARPIPYGGIALAAKTLVAEGKLDQARDLINRYQTYAYGSEEAWILDNAGHGLRAYCNHLLHVLNIRDLKGLSEPNPEKRGPASPSRPAPSAPPIEARPVSPS